MLRSEGVGVRAPGAPGGGWELEGAVGLGEGGWERPVNTGGGVTGWPGGSASGSASRWWAQLVDLVGIVRATQSRLAEGGQGPRAFLWRSRREAGPWGCW